MVDVEKDVKEDSAAQEEEESEEKACKRCESEPSSVFQSHLPNAEAHLARKQQKDEALFRLEENRKAEEEEVEEVEEAEEAEDEEDEEQWVSREALTASQRNLQEALQAYQTLLTEHKRTLENFEKISTKLMDLDAQVQQYTVTALSSKSRRKTQPLVSKPTKNTPVRTARRSTIQNPERAVAEREALIAMAEEQGCRGRRRSIHGFAMTKHPDFLHVPPVTRSGSAGQQAWIDPDGGKKSAKIVPSGIAGLASNLRGKAEANRYRLQIDSGYTMIVTEESDVEDGNGDACESDSDQRGDKRKKLGGVNEHRPDGNDDAESILQEKSLISVSSACTGLKLTEDASQDSENQNLSQLACPASKDPKQFETGSETSRNSRRSNIRKRRYSTKKDDPMASRKKKRDLIDIVFGRVPVLHPESSFRGRWNLLVLVMILWYSFSIPFSIAYSLAPYGWWLAVEIVFDTLFGVDIFLNFITGYYSRKNTVNLIIMNKRMIVYNYMTTWLVVDVLSIIPFDQVALLVSSNSESGMAARAVKLIRLLKLFRLLRLAGLMRYWKYWSETLKPGMLRLFSSIVVGLLTIHFLACVFFLISDLDPNTVDTWSDAYGVRQDGTTTDKYVVSLYWSITTMTTVGYGDIIPQNTTEVAFVIVAMLISCSMFAYFVGNMAHLIASVDSTQTLFKERMEFVREYMNHQDLPSELQNRIKAYYVHCWKNLKSFPFSEDAILEDLSPALRREVVLFLNREMVEKVPFFQGQDESFICKLILAMTSEVCAPLDFVIRQGEVGKCMFFLRRGLVEVCNADASEVYTTLSDGAYFGEVSLLVGGRRTASVRAIFHCSLLRLEQEDLDEVLFDYPDAMKQIVKLAATSKYQLTEAERVSLQTRFEVFHGIQNKELQKSQSALTLTKIGKAAITPDDLSDDEDAQDEDQISPMKNDSSSTTASFKDDEKSVRKDDDLVRLQAAPGHVPLGSSILHGKGSTMKSLEPERRGSIRRSMTMRRSRTSKLIV